ncbi:MAG: hypothetical protein ACD_83C00172G0003, partial [uncultured bacterium]
MFIRFKKGITLIEVLIAAGVLALILGSTVSLGRSVTRNQIITQDRAQALALTVEAAEIIRNLRDSTYVDQTQNRFNEFLTSSNCANITCPNLEISWDTATKNWTIENHTTLQPNNPGIETDNDLDGEVIALNISTGDLSDNTSRAIAAGGGGGGATTSKCADTISGRLLYCRKITLMPLVYDKNSDTSFDSTIINAATGQTTDQINLPLITEEDPAVRGSDP